MRQADTHAVAHIGVRISLLLSRFVQLANGKQRTLEKLRMLWCSELGRRCRSCNVGTRTTSSRVAEAPGKLGTSTLVLGLPNSRLTGNRFGGSQAVEVGSFALRYLLEHGERDWRIGRTERLQV